jgi:hypothetical protein
MAPATLSDLVTVERESAQAAVPTNRPEMIECRDDPLRRSARRSGAIASWERVWSPLEPRFLELKEIKKAQEAARKA